MHRFPRTAAAAFALLAGWVATADEIQVAPPARNWVLPLFTKEGYHQLTLRGDEVRPVNNNQVNISGMTVTVYSGDAQATVESFLSSPAATFLINEKIGQGPGAVRLVRDDVVVTGNGWTYYYDQRKVLIAHDAHVVFHAAMPNMLQ